jgi:hypothetical protein
VIPPGGHLFWCDNDVSQGPLHTSFKLTNRRRIGLFETVDHGNTLVHGSTGDQNTDVSFGFLPDDSDAPDYIATPTPRRRTAARRSLRSVSTSSKRRAARAGSTTTSSSTTAPPPRSTSAAGT